MPHTTRFTLVRHGATILPDHLLGKSDPPLSVSGRQQMQPLIGTLRGIDQCYSSPRKRCLATARRYAERVAVPLTIDARLAELDFGDWDGRPYAELWQEHGEALGNFWQDPWRYPAPNGETMTAFAARIDAWWREMLRLHPGQSILVFSHGGVIRHLMATILQMPLPGSRHLSAIDLPYGTQVRVSVWQDDDGQCWPRIHWGDWPD